jgi:hypothetical protein
MSGQQALREALALGTGLVEAARIYRGGQRRTALGLPARPQALAEAEGLGAAPHRSQAAETQQARGSLLV